jgi:hypothetical protein
VTISRATTLIAAAGAIFLVWMAAVGRLDPADLKVYFGAAGAWLSGEPFYGVPYGLSSGYFKYAPATLFAFAPMQALGWTASLWLQALLTLTVLAFGLPIAIAWIQRLWGVQARTGHVSIAALLLLLVFIAPHVVRELMMGNVNIIALAAASVLAASLSSERIGPVLAGLLMAAVLCFKPHFMVLPALWLWQGRWRAAAATIAGLAVFLLLPQLLIDHPDFAIQRWVEAMTAHNAGGAALNNTVQGLLMSAFGWSVRPAMLATWGTLAIVGAIWLGSPFQKKVNPRREMTQWAVAFALIPNLLATDSEHFIFAAPLLMVIFSKLTAPSASEIPRSARWAIIAALAFAWIPFATASPDLWTADTAAWLERGGALGAANLVLLAVGIYFIPRWDLIAS